MTRLEVTDSAGELKISQEIVLQGEHLSKSFGGDRVLTDVGIELRAGEVHALIGANGSGKSTFVKILSGTHSPDEGSITLGGVRQGSLKSPTYAWSQGIRIVHQEAPLIDALRVSECIALIRGYGSRRGGPINWRSVRREAKAVLRSAGLDINPDELAGELSSSERALVSLALSMHHDDDNPARILILDEASASIPADEAGRLLQQVRKLANGGLSVLMVTHRLKEVSDFADTLTSLNAGQANYSGPATLSRAEMIELITWVDQSASARSSASAPRVEAGEASVAPLDVTLPSIDILGLTTEHLRDVSFSVGAGEVLGLVGGPDSGIEELPLALVGALPRARGVITTTAGTQKIPVSPRDALRRGIVLVPRDRLRQGVIGSLAITENVLLPAVRRYWHRKKLAREVVESVLEDFDVHPRNPAVLARELSGGNQQKVIVGKWLNCNPRLLILDDPTLGVDPVSRKAMFSVLKLKARRSGIGVILLSSEPEQLVEESDRLLAFSDGRVVEELTGSAISHAAVAGWAAG